MISAERLDVIAHAVSDPTRRAIMQRLAQGPATAGQLAALFDIARPSVSRHVRVLREAGLVNGHGRDRHVWYVADDEPLRALAGWLHDTAKRVADAPRLRPPPERTP